jgi:hypothetical protein
MNANKLHVVSFSPVQGCWHVESLADHVRSNARNLGAGTLGVTAYCAVGLAEGHEAAHRCIKQMQTALRRKKPKSAKTYATPTNRKLAGASIRFARARLVIHESGVVLKDNLGLTRKWKGAKTA